MQLKVIQHMFTSTMERLVAEGDLIADTRTALIRYSHSHDIETLLGHKKTVTDNSINGSLRWTSW